MRHNQGTLKLISSNRPEEIQYLSYHVPPIDYSNRVKALLPYLGNKFDRKNIFLGDSNHEDHDIRGMLARPEAMLALHNAGVKHLCLEVPNYYQELADTFWSKKIDLNKWG